VSGHGLSADLTKCGNEQGGLVSVLLFPFWTVADLSSFSFPWPVTHARSLSSATTWKTSTNTDFVPWS